MVGVFTNIPMMMQSLDVLATGFGKAAVELMELIKLGFAQYSADSWRENDNFIVRL